MFKYLLNSIKRKLARRFTREYRIHVEDYKFDGYPEFNLAVWDNPLVEKKKIQREQLDFFKKWIREGDLVIDIGANVGHMSVLFGVLSGKSGLTLSFDPNPYVFRVLKENAGLNKHCSTIHPYNFAISDEDGEYYYFSSEASYSNGGISKEKVSPHGSYTLRSKIKGIHLENFLNANYADALPRLRMVKIDTEGYDKEIIKSITPLLLKYKPIVISECFGKTTSEERFEHFDVLHSRNYKLYYFEDFVEGTRVVPILKKEDMLNWKHFNFYAIME